MKKKKKIKELKKPKDKNWNDYIYLVIIVGMIIFLLGALFVGVF